MKMIIDKDSVVPRYLQVKRHLKAEILANHLQGKIPSERELADQCGVSYLTVRRAVGELVEEGLLYRERGRGTFVSEMGRVSHRTYNIGFVITARQGVANAFYSWIFSGVEAECHKNKYSLFVATTADDLIPLATISDRQYSRKVDGIIAAHVDKKKEHDTLIRISRFVPVVLLSQLSGADNIPSVLVDDSQGACDAVKHLTDLGHRRIAHITGPMDHHGSIHRMDGYKKALADAGIAFDESLVCEGDFTFDSGYAGAARLLAGPDRPTAIFCANDGTAMGAMRWLHEQGLSIPGDVSVVGFDDLPMASQCYPMLTTVRAPTQQIGRIAFRVLKQLIETGATEVEELTKTLSVELVVRESTGPVKA